MYVNYDDYVHSSRTKILNTKEWGRAVKSDPGAERTEG